MLPQPFDAMPVEDLRIVADETFVNDEGKRCVVVFSLSLDAVTCVGEDEERELLALDVAVIKSLPD